MKKRILGAMAVFVLATTLFSGCASITAATSFAQRLTNGIPTSTVYQGKIGETMETIWLDFQVDSITFAEEFNGKPADTGKQFLLIEITETNTYEEPTPLYWDDYHVDGIGFDSYQFPILIEKDNEKGDLPYKGMRPSDYSLDVNETASWLLPFQVPTDTTTFTLTYYEMYGEKSEDSNEYIIPFDSKTLATKV